MGAVNGVYIERMMVYFILVHFPKMWQLLIYIHHANFGLTSFIFWEIREDAIMIGYVKSYLFGKL